MLNYKNKQNGYTVVETMVSISLFVIIVVSGMSALLNANLIHNKSQNMRSIMDNLSFIMEDVSRNLRTGYNFNCGTYSISTFPLPSELANPQDCVNGSYIAFEHAEGDDTDSADQWVYRFEQRVGGDFNISKSTDGGVSWVQLNTDEIVIKSISSFSALGTLPPGTGAGTDPNGTQQPIAFVRIIGEIRYKNIISPFSLQTSSSQRLMDIAI